MSDPLGLVSDDIGVVACAPLSALTLLPEDEEVDSVVPPTEYAVVDETLPKFVVFMRLFASGEDDASFIEGVVADMSELELLVPPMDTGVVVMSAFPLAEDAVVEKVVARFLAFGEDDPFIERFVPVMSELAVLLLPRDPGVVVISEEPVEDPLSEEDDGIELDVVTSAITVELIPCDVVAAELSEDEEGELDSDDIEVVSEEVGVVAPLVSLALLPVEEPKLVGKGEELGSDEEINGVIFDPGLTSVEAAVEELRSDGATEDPPVGLTVAFKSRDLPELAVSEPDVDELMSVEATVVGFEESDPEDVLLDDAGVVELLSVEKVAPGAALEELMSDDMVVDISLLAARSEELLRDAVEELAPGMGVVLVSDATLEEDASGLRKVLALPLNDPVVEFSGRVVVLTMDEGDDDVNSEGEGEFKVVPVELAPVVQLQTVALPEFVASKGVS